jgi:hypothetical protein
MHAYLQGHLLERQGRARVFWWTVDEIGRRFATMDDAANWVRHTYAVGIGTQLPSVAS